jgi:hypothetical protein
MEKPEGTKCYVGFWPEPVRDGDPMKEFNFHPVFEDSIECRVFTLPELTARIAAERKAAREQAINEAITITRQGLGSIRAAYGWLKDLEKLKAANG